MGGGINTYMYNQGSFQTGYYDVRYVHNSFGQALYDMGWLGLIAFIVLFLVGIFVILKGNNQKKYIYLALYLTVYFHSILDFDFAYLFTFLVLAIILAFNGKDDFELKINSKLINIPIVIIGVYIGISSFFLFMANKNYKDGNYNVAIKYADIIDKITVSDNLGKDIKIKSHIAQLDIVQIQKDINSIINDFGPNKKFGVYLDIARGYKALNNIEKASEYYEKTIELQKYSKHIYDEYCSIYKEDSQEANDIINRYNTLMENRSDISKERFK